MPPQAIRRAISIDQKTALRTYKRENPSASNIDIRDWFQTSFDRPIALSSVSEILSKKFAFLDKPHQYRQQRYRPENWPELETVLFEWIKHAEKYILITGAVIREKAEFFWRNLAIYEGKEMPVFSNGWLQGF